MVIYNSADKYIESCQTVRDQIAAINAIQAALMSQALKAASKGPVSQYSLNDGQTIISATYRSTKEITEAYWDFERIKQVLINQINGRMFRLVDGKNLIGNGII